MAFKMKGYQAYSGSPMKEGGSWLDKVKKVGSKVKDYVSNLAPKKAHVYTQDEIDIMDADRKRQQLLLEEQKKRNQKSQTDREQYTAGYKEFIDKYGNSADLKEERDAYAKNYVKKYYADKDAELNKNTPKTKAQLAEEEANPKKVPFAKKKKYK